jgi:hypothetical protein
MLNDGSRVRWSPNRLWFSNRQAADTKLSCHNQPASSLNGRYPGHGGRDGRGANRPAGPGANPARIRWRILAVGTHWLGR